MLRLFICFSIVFASFAANANTGSKNNVTDLNKNKVSQWEHKIFEGQTAYSIVNHKGKRALKAQSAGKASGLFYKERIDLKKTPFMQWSWLAEKKLKQFNEQSKSGDDFVARVYVVIDGGMAVWNSKSLSYVWSSNQAKGQVWNNPYTGSKVKMLSLRGKGESLGQWKNEKRNVYKDLIQYFGNKGNDNANQKAYRFIDVVAIMTDTDNSKSTAESYYGDITFSAR